MSHAVQAILSQSGRRMAGYCTQEQYSVPSTHSQFSEGAEI